MVVTPASSIANEKNWSGGLRQAGAWNYGPDLHKRFPGRDLYDSRSRVDISRCAGDYLDMGGPSLATLTLCGRWRDSFSSTSLVLRRPGLVSHDPRQELADEEDQKGAVPDTLDSLQTNIEVDTKVLGESARDTHASTAMALAVWDWVVFAMYSASYSLRRRIHLEGSCYLKILLEMHINFVHALSFDSFVYGGR